MDGCWCPPAPLLLLESCDMPRDRTQPLALTLSPHNHSPIKPGAKLGSISPLALRSKTLSSSAVPLFRSPK